MKIFRQCMLLALLMILSLNIANAQTESGAIMVGGLLDLDLAFDDDDDAFQFIFTPRYGKFIADGLAVGGQLGIVYEKFGDENTDTDITLGPFTRWYIFGGDLRMLLDAQMSYIYNRRALPASSETNHGFQFFGGPGLSYFLSDNVAIDVILGYNYRTFGEEAASSNLKLVAGFQIFL